MASFSQRLIAALTLLAFLPSAALASLPLVFCEGSDGHRGIEFAVAVDHHDVDRTRGNRDGRTKEAVVSSDPLRCVDQALFIASQLTAQHRLNPFATCPQSPDLTDGTFAVRQLILEPPPREIRSPRSPERLIRPDPKLAAHETVVLLN